MNNRTFNISHDPLFELCPSFLRMYVVLLMILFSIEMLIMLTLPHILSGAPSMSILDDLVDALLLTTISAPFLWKLIVRPLRKMAIVQKTRAETILQHIAEGVVSFDEEGIIESFNPAAEAIFGYSSDELRNRNILMLFSETDSEGRELSFNRFIPSEQEKGNLVVQDLVGLRKDGSLYLMDLSISEVNLDGRIILFGIMRDAAERKKSQMELSLAAKVFENMGEAIGVTDTDNNYISINPAFTRITGYTPEEVIGKNPRLMASGLHDIAFYREMWDSILRNGSWQGEIWDRRKNGDVYPKWLSIVTVKDKYGKILNYIAVFSDIAERKAAEERIHFMAHYDALTRLPNKILLHDRIDRAISSVRRSTAKIAVLFIDLDRFKTINDTLGHNMGDLLLRSAAERLKECVRSCDTVARLGGDEFIIILSSMQETSYAATVAQRILKSLSTPFVINGIELNTSSSIGISIYPDDGDKSEVLISNADIAMYKSKESGRNTYNFFTPDMTARAFERLSMENSLRGALERCEFMLYYQPQVNSETGRITGAEALIRWRHPEKGMIPPGKFIPIAEESGLIIPIGEWVLREACRQNSVWQKECPFPVPVAVNLSAMQFRQTDLAERVANVLRDTGLPPRLLELEITESGVMRDAEAAVSTLQSLKQMGLSISIDDFGTGYSSLSYLKRFPIDKLKIDQSFTRDITTDSDDAAIVAAIIGMAKSLKLRVVAEGVETREQLEFLSSHDCTEIQGYYFCKPIPADEFLQLLLNRTQETVPMSFDALP